MALTSDISALSSVYQPLDADLTSWAAITRAAGWDTFAAQALGAATTVLVGGGVGSAPVWTTATGTGAPVRAGSPTLTGSAVADILAVNALNLSSGDKIRFDDGTGNEYSLFRNASNDIELRRNIGGAAQQGYLFSSGYLGLSQTVRTSLGQSTAGFSDLYLREDGVAAGVGVDTLRLVSPLLAGNITVTLPSATGTLIGSGDTGSLTSAQLRSILTDESGTGLALFDGGAMTSGTINGVNIGATTAGTLRGTTLALTGATNVLSNLLPTDLTYELGSASRIWNKIWALDAQFGNLSNVGTDVTLGGTTNTINGKFTTYNSIATVGNGVPAIYKAIDLTGQVAAIANTTALYTSAPAGMYRMSVALTLTTAGTTSVLGGATGVVVRYTSGDGSISKTQNVPMYIPGATTASTISSATNAIGDTLIGSVVFYSAAGNITYGVGYTAGSPTVGAYAVRVRLEAL